MTTSNRLSARGRNAPACVRDEHSAAPSIRKNVIAAPPLKWTSVVGYGLGDAANNLVFSLGLLFLLNYYTDVAGIDAAAAGSLLLLVRLYDAAMDLIVGQIVDRTRASARWGRFRPYLLYASLPLLLINVAVFSVPATWSASGKLIYAYVTYALLGTVYALVSIPYGALASVMTQAPRERSRLSAARTLLATATLMLLAGVLGPTLRDVHGADLQAQLTRLTLLLAALGMLFHWICVGSCREVVERRVMHVPWQDSLATLRANRPLQMLCLIALSALIGASSAGASALYYARYVLGDARHLLTITAATSGLGMLLGVPAAPRLVGRYGKQLTFRIGMALAATAHLAVLFVPAASLLGVCAALTLGSAGSMLAMTVMWALESDTVEYGEWKAGVRIEGMNYALFSLTRKCGQALGGSIPAFLLAGSAYVPNLATQAPEVLQRITQGVALVPAVAFAIAGLLMAAYPLSDRRFLAMVEEIKARRAA